MQCRVYLHTLLFTTIIAILIDCRMDLSVQLNNTLTNRNICMLRTNFHETAVPIFLLPDPTPTPPPLLPLLLPLPLSIERGCKSSDSPSMLLLVTILLCDCSYY